MDPPVLGKIVNFPLCNKTAVDPLTDFLEFKEWSFLYPKILPTSDITGLLSGIALAVQKRLNIAYIFVWLWLCSSYKRSKYKTHVMMCSQV